MAGGAAEIFVPFLGALQASVSVLLTMIYGLAAAHFGLLEPVAARQISRTSVKMFLPALLIYNLGSQLHVDTIWRYVPILGEFPEQQPPREHAVNAQTPAAWALIYNLVSIALGRAASHIFEFPRWAVPAIAFNNTASMPLLLVQSLNATGLLSSLLMSPDDSTSNAVTRARSYFLTCAVIGNTLTFGIGPAQLKGYEEDAPEDHGKATDADSGHADTPQRVRWQGHDDVEDQGLSTDSDSDNSEEAQRMSQGRSQGNLHSLPPGSNEQTTLLPYAIAQRGAYLRRRIGIESRRSFMGLPSPLRRLLSSIKDFLSPPFVGAVIGIILGLIPQLHRLFFNLTGQGGYFNAWLSQSIQNVGELFVTLQVVIVGVKLSASIEKDKNGGDTGDLPWFPVVFITFVRFVLWPAYVETICASIEIRSANGRDRISISFIWALAVYTNILPHDPMLWFAMMLMPVGPTAMKLVALADVTRTDAKQKMVIAKFLAVSKFPGYSS